MDMSRGLVWSGWLRSRGRQTASCPIEPCSLFYLSFVLIWPNCKVSLYILKGKNSNCSLVYLVTANKINALSVRLSLFSKDDKPPQHWFCCHFFFFFFTPQPLLSFILPSRFIDKCNKLSDKEKALKQSLFRHVTVDQWEKDSWRC